VLRECCQHLYRLPAWLWLVRGLLVGLLLLAHIPPCFFVQYKADARI
jgi:hypothetical protein